jgi:hypothetical protein
MAPAANPLPPGSMTVPLLFGWEHIVTGLLLLVVLAVAYFVISAAGSNTSERAEWQAFLDARSKVSGEPATDLRDESSTLSEG